MFPNTDVLSQNRIFTRLYYLRPELHDSHSQLKGEIFNAYSIQVKDLSDLRGKFFGEKVSGKIVIGPYKDFWREPLLLAVSNKISYDLLVLGAKDSYQPKLIIKPEIEVFFPYIKGFVWSKCYAKVRIRFIVYKDGGEILNNVYEALYFSDGTDREYEGKLTDTLENCANITLGICLRKVLDKFYVELGKKI